MFLAPVPSKITEGTGRYILEREVTVCVEERAFYDAVLTAKAFCFSNSVAFLGATESPCTVTVKKQPDFAKEAYKLSITPAGICIAAGYANGVFYAFMTLAQIIKQCKNVLPALTVEDQPYFPLRGYMFDISRKKIATLESIKEKIDLLASLKYNHFELYIEGTPVRLQSFPDMWEGRDTLTGEDLWELDRYCKARFIEFVPNQNTFGHMAHWINGGYRTLADFGEHESATCLNPLDPGSLALVERTTRDLLPYFSSTKYNVGCDETWDLGKGKTKAACETYGIGKVYFDYLMQMYALCKANGKIMLFWADMLNKFPEYIPQLPRDVIAMNWGYYDDLPTEKSCMDYEHCGIPYVVCPGTAAWNTLIGNVPQMLENTKETIFKGSRHGAMGVVTTEWGDNGHLQGSTTAYPGMLYAAAMSWQPEINQAIPIADCLDALVFEDSRKVMGQLLMQAGRFMETEERKVENTSLLFQLYIRELGEHTFAQGLTFGGFDRSESFLLPLRNRAQFSDMRCRGGARIARECNLNIDMLLTAIKMGRYHLYAAGEDAENGMRLAKEIYYDLRRQEKDLREVWLAGNLYADLDAALAPIRRNIAYLDALLHA